KITVESAELTMLPKTEVAVNAAADARKILRIVNELEEMDDVQTMHANFDIPEAVLKELGDN
ncbi:MAG TPA: YebC/PmpR family DNA-binding transcriptional regulator, partial [bacterium]|nr:YebC/PmpR family DNA-binding transcriptional regulator [bacterium]